MFYDYKNISVSDRAIGAGNTVYSKEPSGNVKAILKHKPKRNKSQQRNLPAL